ncbi:MAG: phage portal protein [Alphaproteobacteria bacterium]|nr:phage portal protein [Alphaproteobacteria bacterium]
MPDVASLLLVAALTAGSPAAGFDQFAQEATGWLLEGKGLPRDYRVTLMQMDSSDRLRAIAYLRRIGLLTGAPWSLDDLLRAPTPLTEPEE